MKRSALLTAVLLALLLAGGLLARPAAATPRAAAAPSSWSRTWAGNAALNWAEGNATGHPYVWAGAGPYGYDCSGLVMAAFAHGAHIALPHSTYAMLASPRLHRIPVAGAPRGALMFFGSGHVELNTVWYHTTFGAHHSGTTVGWRSWNSYYAPTMAFLAY